jgi:hypothetical protein
MKIYAYKIGAVFYVLWGLLHVVVGATFLYELAKGGIPAVLALSGVTVPAASFPDLLGGLLAQHAWNIIWAGLFSTVVAAGMNWRNSRTGYWANLVVVSAFELGLVFAILVPGHVGISAALVGPVIWLLAVGFSTVGITPATRSATRAGA